MKICPVGVELFYPTDIKTLIVVVHIFANMPKNCQCSMSNILVECIKVAVMRKSSLAFGLMATLKHYPS